MDALDDQKVLLSSGSFSGYRPLQQLGSDYLSASAHFKQPLCGNKEGWGPLSPFRYDFTPCFIDVWIATVAVGGLVLGLGAIWYLKKKEKLPANKNFHLWLKQVRCLGIFQKSVRLTLMSPVSRRCRHPRYRRTARPSNH